MSRYVSTELRRGVAERANFLCEYCLIHEDDTFYGCHVDHIISEKHGGSTDLENLAYACALCNRAKGSDIASISSDATTMVRFYNPRTDRWSDHFQLSSSTIVGTTAIGEATARILGYNVRNRIAERELLIQIGRYPSTPAVTLIRR